MNREPMFSCDVEHCAEEVSYPVDMLRSFEGGVYCQGCWEDNPLMLIVGEEGYIEWGDLPSFVPEHEKQLATLTEKYSAIREAVTKLKATSFWAEEYLAVIPDDFGELIRLAQDPTPGIDITQQEE